MQIEERLLQRLLGAVLLQARKIVAAVFFDAQVNPWLH